MKEKKSYLKALSWMELVESYLNLPTKHLEGKVNVCIIFESVLANFFDLETIQIIVSRKKFFTDSSFKTRRFEMFLSSF